MQIEQFGSISDQGKILLTVMPKNYSTKARTERCYM